MTISAEGHVLVPFDFDCAWIISIVNHKLSDCYIFIRIVANYDV